MPNSYVWQAVSKWVTLLSKKGNPHIETIKAKCHYACHSWYLCENLLQHISIYWNIGVSMLIKRKMSVNWLIFASPTLISSLYHQPLECVFWCGDWACVSESCIFLLLGTSWDSKEELGPFFWLTSNNVLKMSLDNANKFSTRVLKVFTAQDTASKNDQYVDWKPGVEKKTLSFRASSLMTLLR